VELNRDLIQRIAMLSHLRAAAAPGAGGYAECFAILGEAGIVPMELSQNLQRMARSRNMLVHMYWEIDYERVYEILKGHLDDLREFVRAIGELL